GVPIDPVQGTRHDVLPFRVDCPGEGFRPISHPIRPCAIRPTPGCLHQLVSRPAKEERIGLFDVLDRVPMYVFVRDHYSMIAAPIQGDIDGISKGSHSVSVSKASGRANACVAKPQLISCPKTIVRLLGPITEKSRIS